MKQTPAHDRHNRDLLRLMSKNLKRVVEVGCSGGTLARAYIAENPGCEYTGIKIDAEYAERAKTSDFVECPGVSRAVNPEFHAEAM
jgi:cyclopropane fatty-acyl-phospholipid synthase-like methyltransferase